MRKYYMLDRVEDGYHVFLLRDKEGEEFILRNEEVKGEFTSGDVVMIEKKGNGYQIVKDQQQTEDMEYKVTQLLERLKNKK